MNLKNFRPAERWERLENVELVKWAFLVFVAACVLWYFAVNMTVANPDMCSYRISKLPGSCKRYALVILQLIGGASGIFAFAGLVRLINEFFRPLQAQPFSPLLRMLLILERLRVEKVLNGDLLEVTFTTLKKNYQPYQPYVLTITGLKECNFYQYKSEVPGAEFHFNRETTLEFYRIENCGHFDHSRIRVNCIHQGRMYSGELELEADSYTLRPLPRTAR